MKITIETIPHSDQRYETCGDWQFASPGELNIRVSDMGNDDYAFLVGIHEAIEAWLAVKRLGPEVEKQLDDFDMAYEDARKPGDESEPGDDVGCPVYLEHQLATGIERMLAKYLKVDWDAYEERLNAL